MTTEEKLKALRRDFDGSVIEKKPKESTAQSDARKQNPQFGISCRVCGQRHHKDAVHLDYVGHAAVTARLLEVDPAWNWEPLAFGADLMPSLDKSGGMWIRLTILGITRLGYGCADLNGSKKNHGDLIKEIIGDAIRNAAMRFGVALSLWHKGESVWGDDDEQKEPARLPVTMPAASVDVTTGEVIETHKEPESSPAPEGEATLSDGQLRVIRAKLKAACIDEQRLADAFGVTTIAAIPASKCNAALESIKTLGGAA